MTCLPEMVINLDMQLTMYRRLLMLSNVQISALNSHDMHGVHATLQEIELAMIERAKIEHQRSELVARIAVEFGVAPDDVTASLIEERAEPSVAREIRAHANELKAIVRELDIVVEKNRTLLEAELAMVDHLVRGMTTTAQGSTYGKSGEQADAARLKLLDAQV